jgi:hypothetical protein
MIVIVWMVVVMMMMMRVMLQPRIVCGTGQAPLPLDWLKRLYHPRDSGQR